MSTSTVTATPSTGASYGVNIGERNVPEISVFLQAVGIATSNLRVAIPAVVVAFDATRQVVSVVPAISEVVRNNGVPQILNLPQLDDVPILVPRAGGFSLTFPIAVGDECLVVFGDMCMDAWWQNGCGSGTPNPQGQIERRRHDLSDGFALFGVWNQKRVLSDYSTTDAQLRSDDGTVVIDLADNAITITAPAVNVNTTGDTIINASADVDINATGNVVIQGVDWLTHQHTLVTVGSGDSGPVLVV